MITASVILKMLFLFMLMVLALMLMYTFFAFLILNIKLTKSGINPMDYFEMIGQGEIPKIVPVDIESKTERCNIVNRWYGQEKFGLVVDSEDGELSIEVTEEEWNSYKKGDDVIIGIEKVTNKETNELIESNCKYYIVKTDESGGDEL